MPNAAVDSESTGGSMGPASNRVRPEVHEPAPSPTPLPVKEFTAVPYPPPDQLGGTEWAYFRETGHSVSRGFKTFFEANGRLPVFGYPITEEIKEDGWTVQYFQRARLEFHPADPRQPVQRSLLGDMLATATPGLRQTEPFQPLTSPPEEWEAMTQWSQV